MSTTYRTGAVADAPADRLWAVVADLAAWPRHTASMTAVRPDGPLGVGMSTVVEQPGLRPTTWTVTEVVDGVSFTWESTAPGVRSVARHTVAAAGDGRARLVLELEQHGPGARVAGLLLGSKVRRFLQMEAEGLAAAAADA